MNAATRRIPSAVGALLIGWWGLLAVLPIGHLTGLRNTWTTLVVIATLLWVGRAAWKDLPARMLLLALLVWCALSIAWSADPGISLAKWRSDLLIPLFAYAAAFGLARRSGSVAAVLGGLCTGLVLLALLSLFVYAPAELRDAIRSEPFPNIEVPMPVWYPGVGDASMAASLATGVLVFARRLSTTTPRWMLVLAWVALVVIVVIANNRNAQIGIPLVALVAVWALTRKRRATDVQARPRRNVILGRSIIAAVLLVGIALVGLRLESGARERLDALRIPVVQGESAFVELTSRDTRPMIWSYYGRLATKSPWFGVGFGRTVPGLRYRTQDDRELAKVETNAYSHAHNLFLNWWLQTGVVGVLLLAAALIRIVADAMRDAASPDDALRAAGLATVAVIALMLIRDATDDFMVYGMATMFWVLVGSLAGLRASARAVPGDHRA